MGFLRDDTASAEMIVRYTFEPDAGNIATDSATAGGATQASLTGSSFVTDPQRGAVLKMSGMGSFRLTQSLLPRGSRVKTRYTQTQSAYDQVS